MSKPFGYSYYLDMYNCRIGAADDLELHYRFLERVVDRIGMTRMSQPIVIHGPTQNGKELYPDKLGVSGWVPLIESGIQIHSIEPKRFITLDVYSCKEFDPNIIKHFAHECFGFAGCEERFFERGTEYANIS
jgi:S-adenosylmethionine decarboxylase